MPETAASTDIDFAGLVLDDVDENEIERLARHHMPIILPWHHGKIRIGTCYQSRVQRHGNPWVRDTPFVLADLYMIPKILDNEHGTVATYKSVSTRRQCETDDHLSLGFGVGVGLPFLASASVKGAYDKDLQENNDVSWFCHKQTFLGILIVDQWASPRSNRSDPASGSATSSY
jgi:hypothetical protein